MLIEDLDEEEKERLMVDTGEDIQVMRVFIADLPPTLSLEVLKEVAERDAVYQRLKEAVKTGRKPKDRDMVPYTAVWEELGVVELLCRGERIVIPEGRHEKNDMELRDWVVDIGHSAHQGVDATKRQLRVSLWFPGMERAVERRVSTCLPCQASMESKARDPLKPIKAPKDPLSMLYADHCGPSQDGQHILVVIDGLTRYPKVVVSKSTSADDNILAFAEIFSRHGVPNRLHSSNGAPFNGKDSRLLQQYLRSMGVVHITNKSAEDPKATGLMEAFMKHLKKIFHTAGVEREDPFMKLTPHATVKKCLAELLFGRRFNTKLPDLRTNPAKERKDIVEAKKVDKVAKERMKKYKDARRHVKDHDIEVGDLVIAKRRTTKDDSINDPKPYKVVTVHATQVKGIREDGKHKTRDSQKGK